MPRISEFYGIVIYMHHGNEHPPPHFHVKYAEHEAKFGIHTLDVIKGELPPAVHRRVRKWARRHQNELLDNFDRTRTDVPFSRIKPWR